MQLQPPAYESLAATDTNLMTNDNCIEDGMIQPVRRRPFSKSLRNRLNHIVSMYIPGNNPLENRFVNIDETTDHTGLLSSNESKLGLSSSMKDTNDFLLYEIKLIYPGNQLIKGILQCANLLSDKLLELDDKSLPKITCLAADHQLIYLGLENLPYIFLISTKLNAECNNQNVQKFENTHYKGCIHLLAPGIGNILPHELCIHSIIKGDNHTLIYIVGTIIQNEHDEKKWILAKFDSTGQLIARSRTYTYQRYSGLSVDTTDNNLLLSCPSINETKRLDNNHISPGQICKLTPGFERRIFSITMGKESVFYKPNYVTQETAGHCCWASVERVEYDYSIENTENIHQPTRRLLAFPGRQPTGGALKQSAREWLHAYSWDFADLKPGRISAYDAERLLVINTEDGTLSYITWIKNDEKPNLHRITRPSSEPIRLLYSTYNSKCSLSELNKNIAYFVAGSSIFSFAFTQNSPPPTTTTTTTLTDNSTSNNNNNNNNNNKNDSNNHTGSHVSHA